MPSSITPDPAASLTAMTPEREAEIRARLADATTGPWHKNHSPDLRGCVTIGNYGWVAAGPSGPEYDVDSEQGHADAEFIAHARQDVPALLAELDRLRARIEELTQQRDDLLVEDALAEQQRDETVPRTERSHWVAIADALNAAAAAGIPVGIDLDGTLTDREAWSVIWDREAERWTVAGYDDGDAERNDAGTRPLLNPMSFDSPVQRAAARDINRGGEGA